MISTMQGYLDFPANAGNYCEVPYDAAFDIASPFTVVAHMAPTVWPPVGGELQIAGRTEAGDMAWSMVLNIDGIQKAYTSADGTTLTTHQLIPTTPATPMAQLVPENNMWIAWNIVYGGTKSLRGWVSAFGTAGTWTQTGVHVLGGAPISPHYDSQPLRFGILGAVGHAFKLFYLAVFPGGDATAPGLASPVFEFDSLVDLDGVAGGATSFTSTSGHTVNMVRAGSGATTTIVAPAATYVPAPITLEAGALRAEMLRYGGGGAPRRRGRLHRPFLDVDFTDLEALPDTLERDPAATGNGVTVYPVSPDLLLSPYLNNGGARLSADFGEMEGIRYTRMLPLGGSGGSGANYAIGLQVGLWVIGTGVSLHIGIAGEDCGVELFMAEDEPAEVRLFQPFGDYTVVGTLPMLVLSGQVSVSQSVGLTAYGRDGVVVVENHPRDDKVRNIMEAFDCTGLEDPGVSPVLLRGPVHCYVRIVGTTLNSRLAYIRRLYGWLETH